MPSSLSEDNPFRAGVLPETQVLLAGQDLLTGLSSRAGLEAHFRLAAARARRSGARLAVGLAALDVDPGAPPDEVFGHDLLMVEAARRLRAVLRETDLIARVGETRFAFIAEEVTPDGVAALADRVTAALASPFGEPSAPVRSLVGIAVGQDEHPTLAALLRAAEDTLGVPPASAARPLDAANAESFSAPADDDSAPAPRSRGRQAVRRLLGWMSLATLLALAVSGVPPELRNRWWPVDATAQRGWEVLRGHWSTLAARLPATLRPTDRR